MEAGKFQIKPDQGGEMTVLETVVLSICPGLITVLCFHFYVLIGMLLQSIVESCLVSKYELQTPNVEKVMAV